MGEREMKSKDSKVQKDVVSKKQAAKSQKKKSYSSPKVSTATKIQSFYLT
jgi:hypothetical protein